MNEKLTNLLISDKTDEALMLLFEHTKGGALEKEIILLRSRYNAYIKNKRLGILEKEDIELNQIKIAIIEYASSTEPSYKNPTNIDFENSKEINQLTWRINNCKYFKDKLIIRNGPTCQLPNLVDEGHYTISKKIEHKSKKIAKELLKTNRPNDPCAGIIDSPRWGDDPLNIHYHPMLYSQIKSCRENNIHVKLLSVNAVIFCEEEEFILVQRRSKKSNDYVNTLHTFGGAFLPGGLTAYGDLGGIRECARREISEETGLSIFIPWLTPTIAIDEFSINYIQITFLGVNISTFDLIDLRPNWEGTVNKIKFNDLEASLKNLDLWTPTGWIHVLYWLALNTPNAKKELKFSNRSSLDLANELLDYLDKLE